MQVTEQILKKWFKEYNDKYWDGKLITPKFAVTYSRNDWGQAHCQYIREGNRVTRVFDYIIRISNYWDTPEDTKRATLIHEMIHHYVHQYAPDEMLWPSYKKHQGHNMDGTWGSEVKRLKKYGWDITRFVKEEELAIAKDAGESKRVKEFRRHDTYTLVFHPLKNRRVFMLKMTKEQADHYIKKSFASRLYTSIVYTTETDDARWQNKPFDAAHGIGYIDEDTLRRSFKNLKEHQVHLN